MKKKPTKKEQKINALRSYYIASTNAFTFVNVINATMACWHNQHPPIMLKLEVLHDLALKEIMKDNPDLKMMDKYMQEIQLLIEENKKPNQAKP